MMSVRFHHDQSTTKEQVTSAGSLPINAHKQRVDFEAIGVPGAATGLDILNAVLAFVWCAVDVAVLGGPDEAGGHVFGCWTGSGGDMSL